MGKLFCCWLMVTGWWGQSLNAQLHWINVDSLYGPLPSSVHVYKTIDPLDGKPNIAYYMVADLKDRDLSFDTDTSHKRRLTPLQFYQNNNQPLVTVNCTFFSFQTNQNLSVVIKNKKLVGYNVHSIPGRGRDTFTYRHPVGSAIGISKNRNADIAWLYTDSSQKHAYALQFPIEARRNSEGWLRYDSVKYYSAGKSRAQLGKLSKWRMQSAVGGGPVLIQERKIMISNNEELKFAGKAMDDKHPRTAMGYTQDKKLIILVIQGRFPNIAEGASLTQTAQILKDLGCWEAMNLDGGGSSCMLVNGKETIKPSDAGGQRPVPAVFLLTSRHSKSRLK